MVLRYTRGFIEFYNREDFPEIARIVNGLGAENFFNLTVHEQFLNNNGSIIIPFARLFRTGDGDADFLNEQVYRLMSRFLHLDGFALEVWVESGRFDLKLVSCTCVSGSLHIVRTDHLMNKVSESKHKEFPAAAPEFF